MNAFNKSFEPDMNKAETLQGKPVFTQHIHLLYVPTLHCNLSCRYCYLGSQTDTAALKVDSERAVQTLQYALGSFINSGILPFNVSLHGGEVTTLPASELDSLFRIIRDHYTYYYDELTALGYRKSVPHVKTNLFNFHKLYDLFDRNKVSISASIDLPLSLHGKYRTDRRNQSWLEGTLKNIRLLGKYPHSKKISSTICMEHIENTPEIIDDIWRIHNELGFDMNNFNFMFGFESSLNNQKYDISTDDKVHQATEVQQKQFYEKMKEAFTGTVLEYGLKRNWFDEFKPEYCTNSLNCGEKFFLLQSDGSVYSCVRGQGLPEFYYGNILNDPVKEILSAAKSKVNFAHQEQGLDPECMECGYIGICRTGCPIVKKHNAGSRSYTCSLQKAIYRDNPKTYPDITDKEEKAYALREYIAEIHPGLMHEFSEEENFPQNPAAVFPSEIQDEKNSLSEIINRDPVLETLYSGSAFILAINGEQFALKSQILKRERPLYTVGPSDKLELYIRKKIFEINCDEVIRNTLYVQLLRDTPVVYGDEKRTKQEHIATHQIFYNFLKTVNFQGEEFLMSDITGLLSMYRNNFIKNILNNIFITTYYLREYHYQKQKANAFYHIQALNLPFQNFEFFWDENK
jgi:uncharacterized protein